MKRLLALILALVILVGYLPVTHVHATEAETPATEETVPEETTVPSEDNPQKNLCPDEHSFGEWSIIREPTCAMAGEERRDCQFCDYFETREVAALPHDYIVMVTDPTCTEQGYTTYLCGDCAYSYVGDYVDPIPHYWDEGVVTKQPTEDTPGIRTFTCEACGTTKEVEIPAGEHIHEYVSVVTEPDCVNFGYTTHTCACGDSYIDTYTDALGHDFSDWVMT